jgi:lipopolysaccharide/colanic/teichoic acid biosynthesis glycosyltransferase
MHTEGAGVSSWARDNLTRITRIGRFLRWSHLDELPQLVNVLRGDMNLVGPRPHPVSNLALFNAGIPYYALRSAIRPGVTGWAQVCYRYANTLQEESEKMRYDLYYIKHRSLWLDLRILASTVRVLLLGLRPEPVMAAETVALPRPQVMKRTA